MDQTNNTSSNKGTKVITGVISILAVIGIIFGINRAKAPTVETGVDTPTPTPTATAVASTVVYKDGTYTAEGTYNSPAGEEKVSLQIKLENDLVTEAIVVAESKSPVSKEFQKKFISGFSEFVIGKNIDTLNLTKVSGSSLTPKGFNDAVSKIKVQAKA